MKLGWAQGADAVEIDLWLSTDGKIIVFHDGDTKRFETPARKITSLTLGEARALDVGAWKDAKFSGERIPKLEEILATIPAGKRLLIELKSGPEIVPELARVLRAAARPDAETCIISFNAAGLAASKIELPKLKHYFLSSWKKDTSPELAPLIAKAKAASFDGLSLAKDWPITAALAAEVKAAGLALHTWTINDAPTARRWIAAGAETVTTDRPAALREALR